MRINLLIWYLIIAYPSEKGGYNYIPRSIVPSFIIAYPSEKGGYNLLVGLTTITIIIAYPSEKGGYNIFFIHWLVV